MSGVCVITYRFCTSYLTYHDEIKYTHAGKKPCHPISNISPNQNQTLPYLLQTTPESLDTQPILSNPSQIPSRS